MTILHPSINHDMPHSARELCRVLICGLIILLSSGCVHTKTGVEDEEDPTEVEVTLSLELNRTWGAMSEEVYRADATPWRIFVAVKGRNEASRSFTHFLSAEEATANTIKLPLPFKLKAEDYNVAVWADCLNPTDNSPAYDITNPLLISELRKRGEETDLRTCLTGEKAFSLRQHSGKWNESEEISLSISSPMARIRLVASDYAEFLIHTEAARAQGESYYVTVNYDSEIPGGFSLPDGMAMNPIGGAAFTTDLPIIVIPGIEMCIASDWLFNPASPHTHTLTVSVFNSAKVMVSQTSGISVTTERGKITTVSGRMLTNFISGGISIDNIWGGEIIIEVD